MTARRADAGDAHRPAVAALLSKRRREPAGVPRWGPASAGFHRAVVGRLRLNYYHLCLALAKRRSARYSPPK
jgi:hypothetical protein